MIQEEVTGSEEQGSAGTYKDDPPSDPLAKAWGARIEAARSHWKKFHERVKHNRELVAGFDWKKDPDSSDFYKLRANLIHSTITAMLPNIYARNPEISVTSVHQGADRRLFCETLQKVTNRQLEKAGLKKRAKASVRAALTVSFGVLKVLYQRDLETDPVAIGRMNDAQDNIARVQKLLHDVNDQEQRACEEERLAELQQTLEALKEQSEIVAAEGLIIDRVLTEHLVLDPTLAEIADYADSDWMAQIIPMKLETAQQNYGYKLEKAKTYKGAQKRSETRTSLKDESSKDERQISIIEIWDKRSQRVYTMAEGCDGWLREPYTPSGVGERWYPFFVLPFQQVDGTVIAPSLVDLTEKLQGEHNDARDGFNDHRELCKPGWIASSTVNEKTIKRFSDSVLGEITLVDAEGAPIGNVIVPKQHPPIDPAVYDTSGARYDWEQVTGLQDAARSTIVQAKTATEASIQQQALSGRVSEFRDHVEDWLQEISQYSAQILLLEMEPAQVERIMGPPLGVNKVVLPDGTEMEMPIPSYDWPTMDRESIFEMIDMKIRAGTTGEPDKLEQQETWIKLLPVLQPLITQIVQLQSSQMDAEPFINVLKETVARFDEKLDVDMFIPKAPPQAAPTVTATSQ